MNRGSRIGLILAVSIGAGLAGMWARQGPGIVPRASVSEVADKGPLLLATKLPDASGTLQALDQWRGQILVANFWATWCPPCLKELPEFAQVSRRYADKGVQFVGISIDQVEAVQRFQAEHQIPYPLLIGSAQTLQLAADLGNPAQALPFTLILDRNGRIRDLRLGTLTEADLIAKIEALLKPSS